MKKPHPLELLHGLNLCSWICINMAITMTNTLLSYLALTALIFFSITANASKPFDTISVQVQSYPNTVSIDAFIEPTKAATVSAQTSGRIIKLNYDVNDVVQQGASLLEITSIEQGAQLAASKADYAKAEAINTEAHRQLQRYQTLFPKGAISKGEMDQAEANASSAAQELTAAKARIAQALESLNYTVVSAPFSGIVTQRHVEEGEAVTNGQALYSGYAVKPMRAIAQIPQRYMASIERQPKLSLTLANGEVIESEALTVFSFADPQSHSVKIRITLPENIDGVVPGSFIKAHFVSGHRRSIFIPQSALVSINELSGVYLQQGNTWVLNQIRTGLKNGENIEVLSGLADGERIAKDGYQAMMTLSQNQP